MSDAEPTPARAPRRPIGLAVIMGVLGLGLAWATWSQVAELRYLAAHGTRVEAQIVSVDQQTRRGSVSYIPIFLFRTADGRVARERSSETLTSDEAFAGRARVNVLYDPADPSRVRLATSVAEGVGALPWILGVLSMAALGLAAVALFKRPAG